MKHFLKAWGWLFVVLIALFASRAFLWNTADIAGTSMAPTLQKGDSVVTVSPRHLSRGSIVIVDGANVPNVFRVIGLPGDTVSYNHDVLSVNGNKTLEPYLVTYKAAFAKDKLQSTYTGNANYQALAKASASFTTDANGASNFSVKVPAGRYFLLGDNRPVSQDSRQLGSFTAAQIKAKVLLRYNPLTRLGGVR